jgi:hypothetical protein
MQLTGQQAIFLLDVANSFTSPAIYADSRDKVARDLEAMGLLERHWSGSGKKCAVLTETGRNLLTRLAAM